MREPTLSDIYRELGEVHTKVRQLVRDDREQAQTLEEHDDRLRGLEKWRAYLLGIIAAVSAVFGFGGK